MDELKFLRETTRDLRGSFDQLSALQHLSIEISTSQTTDDIIASLMQIIPQVVRCAACRVYLFENDSFTKLGETQYDPAAQLKEMNEEVIYWCCKRSSVTVQPGESDKSGQAIAPLICASEVVGVIIIDLGENIEDYSELTGLALATIATHTALAISNRKSNIQLEEKAQSLNNMKDYVDQVFASIIHAVISFDPDGKITVFNRQAENFFRIRSKIAVGTSYSVMFSEPLKNVFSELLFALQNGQMPPSREVSFRSIFNDETSLLITASPLKVTGTSKPGMVCVCQDLSLSKELERLRELDKMKDDFISMVSHELKTPLSSILAYSESLLNGQAADEKEEKEYLKVIFDEGNRLAQLVNDVLDLSKIESGKMNFSMVPFRPSDLVEKSAASIKSLCRKKRQELSLDIEKGLPKVSGDFEKLTQVMLNLLSNAIKFTEPGGRITAGIKRAPEKENTAWPGILFFVEDTGIGINEEDFPKVFDKFTQVEDMSNHAKGTGLGVPISHQILLRHGSRLELVSQKGKGSCFSFVLRALETPDKIESDEREREP